MIEASEISAYSQDLRPNMHIFLVSWWQPTPYVYLASSLLSLPTGWLWYIMYIFLWGDHHHRLSPQPVNYCWLVYIFGKVVTITSWYHDMLTTFELCIFLIKWSSSLDSAAIFYRFTTFSLTSLHTICQPYSRDLRIVVVVANVAVGSSSLGIF